MEHLFYLLNIISSHIHLTKKQFVGTTPFDNTAGLTPCDYVLFFTEIYGLNSCNFFNFWPKMDKTAVLTPCDFFSIFDQN